MMPISIQVTFAPDTINNLKLFASKMADANQVMLDVVKQVTEDMQKTALANSPYDADNPHKKGPHMKTQWSEVYQVDGGFAFGNASAYAHVLEFGLYRGVGPKTEYGIYAGKDTGWNSYGIFSKQTLSSTGGSGAGGMLGVLETDGRMEQSANKIIDAMMEYFTKGF